MPQLVKPYTYTSGSVISSTQVNANEDAIINTINALDEDNFDAGTQIPNSMLAEIQPDIVDAHADSATEYLTATTPGTTAALLAGSTALPALLTDELERLRYRILGNNHLISTYFMDSAAAIKDAGWVESAPFGPQLFSNNGFDVKTSASANAAPDNWTLEGTPTSLVITAPGLAVPLAGVNKKALRITCSGAANEGIKQTLSGLKASTKYLIGMTFAKVSGTPILKITTTGGLSSGAYQNLGVTTSTAATISNVQAIVQTASNGDPLVVKFTNTVAAADVFDLYQVWAYEVKDSTNLGLPHILTQSASVSSATSGMTGWTGTGNAWRTDTLTGLSLTAYVPAAGYRLIYEVSVPIRSTNNSDEGLIAYGAIQRNVDGGGASTVVGPAFFEGHAVSSNGTFGHTFSMRYVLDNPTPGSSYAMTFLLGAYDAADYADVIAYPSVNAVQMAGNARLIMERL